MTEKTEFNASTTVSGRGRPPDREAPLEAFTRAIANGRFEGRVARFVPVALILVVAIVAGRVGTGPALGIGIGIGLGLVVVSLVWERPYWHAQDVLYGYLASRHQAWVRDTGGPSPIEDAVASEVWLGVHKVGTVPQYYRAVAAGATADQRRFDVELGRMPDATDLDGVLRLYAAEGRRFNRSGSADTGELEALLGRLPSSDLKTDIESWLAIVDAHRRWSLRERDWLAPLEADRSRTGRRALPRRQAVRVWSYRLGPILAFAIGSLLLGSFAVRDAENAAIRPEYEQTTYAIRGEMPAFDDQAFIRTLPALERAIAGSTRGMAEPLDDETFDAIVNDGLPTLIWGTGRIEVAKPPDAGDKRVWEIEALLGSDAGDRVIVTFDGPSGPRYLYDIDPSVFESMRSASGLPPRSD